MNFYLIFLNLINWINKWETISKNDKWRIRNHSYNCLCIKIRLRRGRQSKKEQCWDHITTTKLKDWMIRPWPLSCKSTNSRNDHPNKKVWQPRVPCLFSLPSLLDTKLCWTKPLMHTHNPKKTRNKRVSLWNLEPSNYSSSTLNCWWGIHRRKQQLIGNLQHCSNYWNDLRFLF